MRASATAPGGPAASRERHVCPPHSDEPRPATTNLQVPPWDQTRPPPQAIKPVVSVAPDWPTTCGPVRERSVGFAGDAVVVPVERRPVAGLALLNRGGAGGA